MILALALSPAVQVAEAFSTLGASLRPLRFGPVLLLQFAIRFIALAVPSSAARIALSVRFFQRSGAPTSEAIAIGAIDSVSGFVIQALILAIVALANLVTLDLPTQDLPELTGKLLILGAGRRRDPGGRRDLRAEDPSADRAASSPRLGQRPVSCESR